jgi:hypothetical protein
MAGFGVMESRPLSFGLSTIPTKTMSPGLGILFIFGSRVCRLDISDIDAYPEK